MDHAEAREALELAAIEPGGAERLEAGDTAESASLAGHLLGCADCAAEWEQLRRTTRVLRAVLAPVPGVERMTAPATGSDRRAGVGSGSQRDGAFAATPEGLPADLRERTLRLVHAVGRERSGQRVGRGGELAIEQGRQAGSAGRAETTVPGPVAAVPPSPVSLVQRAASRGRLARILAIAAVVVLAFGLAGFAYLNQQGAVRERDALVAVLGEQAQLAGQADARAVQLRDAAGTARGSLLFSAGSGDLVMIATGLPQPAAGKAYSCWMEAEGGKTRLGPVDVVNGVAYWSGWSADLARLQPGAQFGVSLVDAGSGQGAETMLSGTLGSKSP